jgi:hypothetical protein
MVLLSPYSKRAVTDLADVVEKVNGVGAARNAWQPVR